MRPGEKIVAFSDIFLILYRDNIVSFDNQHMPSGYRIQPFNGHFILIINIFNSAFA